jgi:pilus assembly protein Flp/PilA
MNAIAQGIERFITEEDGVTMVEYGLIAALISIVVLVFLTNTGTNLKLVFQKICNALAGAVTGGTTC